MAEDLIATTGIAAHGATRLPSVEVDSFNLELKHDSGFLGDRATKGAFRAIFDRWRKPLRKTGKDPFGELPSERISKKALDDMLIGDDTEASAVVHRAIEEFAQELAQVIRRFLKTRAWAKTERIVVGGGLRDSRLGELAIARTEIILKSEGLKVDVLPIRFDPDEVRYIWRRHGYSRRMTAFLPSISVSPISAAAWSRRAGRRHLTCRRPRCGSRCYGDMPMTSRPAKAP